METGFFAVVITRQGLPVAGSPFKVKLRYRRLHIDPQIAPIAARRPIQEFLLFQDIDAPVLVGDMVALPDGTIAKIIDVRGYPSSLQCPVQRVPYVLTPVWIPLPPSANVGSTKRLGDVTYVSGGSALLLLEPVSRATPTGVMVGQLDQRTCYVFSTMPLAKVSVLDVLGEYWLLTESSSFWPITADYRAVARLLSSKPLGVS